jgi:integrase
MKATLALLLFTRILPLDRPPLPVGTAGKIRFQKLGKRRVRARCNVRDYDGETREVTRFGPTQAAAERRLKEALRDRVGPPGDGEITADTRLRDTAELWRAEMEDSDNLSEQTKEIYARALARIVKALGGLLMREIDVPRCDKFIKAVRKNHGPSAAKTAKTVLSLLLGMAVRHGALDTNPIRDVAKISAGRRARPRALTVEEEIDLLKRVASEAGVGGGIRTSDELDLGDIVEFMLGTGVRIGEALAVRQTVVDLEAGVLEVSATVVRLAGRGAVLQERTKSDAGWRVIALPDHVVELCRRRMAMAWPGNELGLLFPTAVGGVRNPSNVQRGLRAVLDRIGGYDWVVPHTFRKTVATRLDDAGQSARQIADHLGHAKPSMTQDTYLGRAVASAEAAKILDRRDS